MPKEFENLFKELLTHGGNAIELSFWKDMIPVLGQEERENLRKNLEQELKLRIEKEELSSQPNIQ
ncbi:MAG: hypothetical protein WAW92_04620 [Minisyncoccia bacterium]